MTRPDPLLTAVVARRQRLRRRPRRRRRALLLLALGVVLLALAAVAGAAAGAHWYLTRCTLAGRTPAPLGRTSVVYAADGTYLGAIRAETYRRVVRADRISPWAKRATVAIEDRRFWSNDGIDIRSIARAAIADLRAGRVVQGGSTLTQQLVRNMYLDDTKSLERKRLEACLALKLTRRWSKARILTSYLNRAPYGERAYGIEAAAETYFSVHARDLGPAQAALLAGLPQSPSAFDPFVHPTRALARRNAVLRALRRAGDLSPTRYRVLAAKPLGLHRGYVYRIHRAPTFFAYVRAELVRAYGEARVRRGGLRVYTTLVPRDQSAARRAIRQTLDRRNDPAAAVASVDPRTGGIRALVGVVPGRTLSFSLPASARRQAGSAFKTFVLAAAIARGVNPYATRYRSAPFTYRLSSGATWTPRTYERTYGGVETLADATLRSDNIVFAKLTLDLGPKSVARMAKRLGVHEPLQAVPSIGLGSNAVSPLSMASAYATLAAGGVYRAPHAIRKVVLPGGRVDTAHRWSRRPKRVLPGSVAYWVTRVLQANVERGTGTAARLGGLLVAGKTGTTSNWTDGWFVGYTRRRAAAVWVGYVAKTRPMTSVHGIHVAGGTFPAQIWARYARTALAGKPPAPWLAARQQIVWKTWRGRRRYVPPTPAAKPAAAHGTRGYVAVLGTFSVRAHATAAARARQQLHAAASSELGLDPGYFTVYAGPFASERAARAAATGGYVHRLP